MSEDLNQVMKIRREKLDLLREKGINPFPYRFERTHLATAAGQLFQETEEAEALI